MRDSPLHELLDVSVLFASLECVRSAWSLVFRTSQPDCVVAEGKLTGLARLSEEEMPADVLDPRLIDGPFSAGAGYIGIKLGVKSQFEIRWMLTNPATGLSPYPDPWAKDGLMRSASVLVERLLGLGGTAVVLHKAAATVKAADQFRAELQDVRDSSNRPWLAWLDMLASEDGTGGVVCRCYGMPHYFGAPNVRALAPNTESKSVECAMAAVRYVCQEIAGDNKSPFVITKVVVPSFVVAGTAFPEIEWTASFDEDSLLLTLTTKALGTPRQSVWRGWLNRFGSK